MNTRQDSRKFLSEARGTADVRHNRQLKYGDMRKLDTIFFDLSR